MVGRDGLAGGCEWWCRHRVVIVVAEGLWRVEAGVVCVCVAVVLEEVGESMVVAHDDGWRWWWEVMADMRIDGRWWRRKERR